MMNYDNHEDMNKSYKHYKYDTPPSPLGHESEASLPPIHSCERMDPPEILPYHPSLAFTVPSVHGWDTALSHALLFPTEGEEVDERFLVNIQFLCRDSFDSRGTKLLTEINPLQLTGSSSFLAPQDRMLLEELMKGMLRRTNPDDWDEIPEATRYLRLVIEMTWKKEDRISGWMVGEWIRGEWAYTRGPNSDMVLLDIPLYRVLEKLKEMEHWDEAHKDLFRSVLSQLPDCFVSLLRENHYLHTLDPEEKEVL